MNDYDVNEQRKREQNAQSQAASREIITAKMHFQCEFAKFSSAKFSLPTVCKMFMYYINVIIPLEIRISLCDVIHAVIYNAFVGKFNHHDYNCCLIKCNVEV